MPNPYPALPRLRPAVILLAALAASATAFPPSTHHPAPASQPSLSVAPPTALRAAYHQMAAGYSKKDPEKVVALLDKEYRYTDAELWVDGKNQAVNFNHDQADAYIHSLFPGDKQAPSASYLFQKSVVYDNGRKAAVLGLKYSITQLKPGDPGNMDGYQSFEDVWVKSVAGWRLRYEKVKRVDFDKSEANPGWQNRAVTE